MVPVPVPVSVTRFGFSLYLILNLECVLECVLSGTTVVSREQNVMYRFDKVAGADTIKIVDFGRSVFVAPDAKAPPKQPDNSDWKGCSSTPGYVAPFVSGFLHLALSHGRT